MFCFLFDVFTSSSNPSPLVVFLYDLQNPKVFSRGKVPVVNPLLSVVWSWIISCFKVELVITHSFSSIFSKYVDRSPSLCVKKLKLLKRGQQV